jgi:hypothetical protein
MNRILFWSFWAILMIGVRQIRCDNINKTTPNNNNNNNNNITNKGDDRFQGNVEQLFQDYYKWKLGKIMMTRELKQYCNKCLTNGCKVQSQSQIDHISRNITLQVFTLSSLQCTIIVSDNRKRKNADFKQRLKITKLCTLITKHPKPNQIEAC